MPAEITALENPTWHNVSDLYDTETHLNLSMLYQRKKHKKRGHSSHFWNDSQSFLKKRNPKHSLVLLLRNFNLITTTFPLEHFFFQIADTFERKTFCKTDTTGVCLMRGSDYMPTFYFCQFHQVWFIEREKIMNIGTCFCIIYETRWWSTLILIRKSSEHFLYRTYTAFQVFHTLNTIFKA